MVPSLVSAIVEFIGTRRSSSGHALVYLSPLPALSHRRILGETVIRFVRAVQNPSISDACDEVLTVIRAGSSLPCRDGPRIWGGRRGVIVQAASMIRRVRWRFLSESSPLAKVASRCSYRPRRRRIFGLSAVFVDLGG